MAEATKFVYFCLRAEALVISFVFACGPHDLRRLHR